MLQDQQLKGEIILQREIERGFLEVVNQLQVRTALIERSQRLNKRIALAYRGFSQEIVGFIKEERDKVCQLFKGDSPALKPVEDATIANLDHFTMLALSYEKLADSFEKNASDDLSEIIEVLKVNIVNINKRSRSIVAIHENCHADVTRAREQAHKKIQALDKPRFRRKFGRASRHTPSSSADGLDLSPEKSVKNEKSHGVEADRVNRSIKICEKFLDVLTIENKIFQETSNREVKPLLDTIENCIQLSNRALTKGVKILTEEAEETGKSHVFISQSLRKIVDGIDFSPTKNAIGEIWKMHSEGKNEAVYTYTLPIDYNSLILRRRDLESRDKEVTRTSRDVFSLDKDYSDSDDDEETPHLLIDKVFDTSFENILAFEKKHLNSSEKEIIIFKVLIEQIVEKNGLSSEGIFRVSPDLEVAEKYKQELNKGNYNGFEFDDPNLASNALKVLLRSLIEPLIPQRLYDTCVQIGVSWEKSQRMKLAVSAEQKQSIQKIWNGLSYSRQQALRRTVGLFESICDESHRAVTMMTMENFAILFAPVLLRNPIKDPRLAFSNIELDTAFLLALFAFLRENKLLISPIAAAAASASPNSS